MDILRENAGNVGPCVGLTSIPGVGPVVEALVVLHVAVLGSQDAHPHGAARGSFLTEVAGDVVRVTVNVLPPTILIAVNLGTQSERGVAILPVFELPLHPVCPGPGTAIGVPAGSYPDIVLGSKLTIYELLHLPGLDGGEVSPGCLTHVSRNLPGVGSRVITQGVLSILEGVPVHRHGGCGGTRGGGGGGLDGVDGDRVLHEHVTNVANIFHLLPDVIQILASCLAGAFRFSRQSSQAISWKFEGSNGIFDLLYPQKTVISLH